MRKVTPAFLFNVCLTEALALTVFVLRAFENIDHGFYMMIYSEKKCFFFLSQKLLEMELFSNIQYYCTFYQGIQRYHQIEPVAIRNM